MTSHFIVGLIWSELVKTNSFYFSLQALRDKDKCDKIDQFSIGLAGG